MNLRDLKVLQLIDTLDTGGAERMAVNMANAFSEQRISNLLVVSRSYGKLQSLVNDPSSLRLLSKKNTLDWKSFRKLLAALDQFKPDILHAHGTSLYWAVAAKVLRPRFRLIWHDHLGISEDVIQNNPRKELKWMGSKIDFVLTANESTKDFWKEKGLIASDRIEYVANFPSLSVTQKEKPAIFTFLHLANYRNEKGQLNLLNAAGILHRKGLDFRLRMVGKEVDQAWKSQVMALRTELKLEEKISVEDSVEDVSTLLAEVHAGIVASDREGLPVSLLEYGLASLPVISTNVGQCPEVLVAGTFGRLVPAQDAGALAKEMEGFLINPNQAAELGARFRAHVELNYGPSHFMQAYSTIVEQIISDKPKKH